MYGRTSGKLLISFVFDFVMIINGFTCMACKRLGGVAGSPVRLEVVED
jgi:hypothetical protein